MNSIKIIEISRQSSKPVQIQFFDPRMWKAPCSTDENGTTFPSKNPIGTSLLGSGVGRVAVLEGFDPDLENSVASGTGYLYLDICDLTAGPVDWAIVDDAIEIQEAVEARLDSRGGVVSYLGRAYDTVLGEFTGKAPIAVGTILPDRAMARFTGHVCTTFEQLTSTLQMDQSLSGAYASGKTSISADSRETMLSRIQLSQWTVNVVYDVYHPGAVYKGADFSVASSVYLPKLSTEVDKFIIDYGDSFVSNVIAGGFFYAVYTFHAQSSDEQQDVVKQLKANGISDGFAINAATSSTLHNAILSIATEATVEVDSKGFTLPMPTKLDPNNPVDNDALANWALYANATEPQPDSILEFEYTPYHRILSDLCPQPVVSTLGYIRSAYCDPDVGFIYQAARLRLLKNQINAIKSIFAMYRGYYDINLDREEVAADSDLQVLTDYFANYNTSPSNFHAYRPHSTPRFPSLELHVAQGPYLPGSQPAQQYDDVASTIGNIRTSLTRGLRISVLRIDSGDTIDRLHVEYIFKENQTRSFDHGGNNAGVSPKVLNLDPDEYVTGFSGTYGSLVNDFTLTTSKNNSVSGGRGKPTPNMAVKWSAGDFEVVVGFSGSSGDRLNSVAALVVQLQPVRWWDRNYVAHDMP